jgi:hypothetical protein
VTIVRLQCGFGWDSAFPRDRCYINPTFEDNAGLELGDWDGPCEDLATALDTWTIASPVEITVKAYDAQGTPPVYPIGSAVRNLGLNPSVAVPREVALCLSYYSTNNVPRRRGRLYVPAQGFAEFGAGLRPTAAQIAKVAALAPIFEGLGGANIDWVVFSKLDNDARPVTNWWVDNEWDTIRSRGMRGTTRTTGTTSE